MKHKNYYVDGSSPKWDSSSFCVFRGNKLIKSKVLKIKLKVYEIEFIALIEGLKLAEDYSTVYSDNKQIIDEVNLVKKPKNQEYFKKARKIIKEKNLKAKKVNRKNNPAGKYLTARLNKLSIEEYNITHPKQNPKLRKLKYVRKRRK